MARKLTEEEDAFRLAAKAAREARDPKMSQEKLAKLVKVRSARTIIDFEHGRTRIHPATAERIAEVLGLAAPHAPEGDDPAPAEPQEPQEPQVQPMTICPTCNQIVAPDRDTRTFVNILLAAMDVLTEEERQAFRRKVTRRDVMHLPE